MFEEKPEYAAMVDRLYAIARPMRRGDVIGHEQVTAVLGVEPNADHWKTCVAKLKRRMERERGITLWPEPGVGYALCTIQQQIDLGRLRLVRARRQVKRGIRHIEALPTEGLTLHQRRLIAAHSENLRKSHRELTVQIQTRLPTQHRTPTLPRPRPHP